MASKPKSKMPVSERAKQFMPFSALKGLEEAIEKKIQKHEANQPSSGKEQMFFTDDKDNKKTD